MQIRSRDAIASEPCEIFYERPPSKKGGGAPTGAFLPWPHHAIRCCHLTALRARQRTLFFSSPACGGRIKEGALASRRSTAVSFRRPNAGTQPRPRFTRTGGRRRYPRHRSRLSEAPRAPVVMPAGTMPGPPGSGVTSPARGNRTRPIDRLSPVDVPSIGRDLIRKEGN